MQTVVIKRTGEEAHLQCAICGAEEELRYAEDVTTKYIIRGLHGHTLRIAGEGVPDNDALNPRILCGDCGAELEMPSWMETEASET